MNAVLLTNQQINEQVSGAFSTIAFITTMLDTSDISNKLNAHFQVLHNCLVCNH